MSPTRHRLGEPLPHQQADKPRTSPKAELITQNLYQAHNKLYAWTIEYYLGFLRAILIFRVYIHVLLTHSPLPHASREKILNSKL
jgi:hypothetical protein